MRRVTPFSFLWICQSAHPPTADATAVKAATESDNHVGTWSVYVRTLLQPEWERVLGLDSAGLRTASSARRAGGRAAGGSRLYIRSALLRRQTDLLP